MSTPALTSYLGSVADIWFDQLPVEKRPDSLSPTAVADALGLKDIGSPPAIYSDFIQAVQLAEVRRLIITSTQPLSGEIWISLQPTSPLEIFNGLGFGPKLSFTRGTLILDFGKDGVSVSCVLADGSLQLGASGQLPLEIAVSSSEATLTLGSQSSGGTNSKALFGQLAGKAGDGLPLPFLENATLKALRLGYVIESKSASFCLTVADPWQVTESIKLEGVSVAYETGTGDFALSGALQLDATDPDAPSGTKTAIECFVSGSHDADTGWTLSAAMIGSSATDAAGKSVPTTGASLATLLSSLAGGAFTPSHILADVVLESASISYTTKTGDFTAGCDGSLLLESFGTSLKFDISFDKSAQAENLTLTLAGLTFQGGKQTNGPTILSLSGKETIHLSDLARLLRIRELQSISEDPALNITGAFWACTSGNPSKKLLGLQFSFTGAELNDPITHFITGGGSLGISGGTFLAATDAWTATEVASLGTVVGNITLPPEVRKGPNFTAKLAVGTDKVSSPLTPSGQQPPAGSTPAPAPVTSSSATRWFEVQKKVGPLTLARAGLAMAKTDAGKPQLDVKLDASFMLGPITITLDQFGMDIPIEWPLVITDFGISLHGLQITFDKAPLLISGGLLHSTETITKNGQTTTADIYIGDVIIHTEALSLTAIGEYAKMADGTTSLALLAVLNDPPLGGPAFCFVTGIAAGFGYNNLVHLPTTIADLPNCQLIQALDPVNAIDLEKLKTELQPTPGNDWLALGLLFRSFEMIQSSALLIAQFSSQDLKLSLLAQSELSIPPNSAERLAYAQLDVEATLDLGTGSLLVLGVLTDKSYVIAPECKLTGGFAFLVNDQGDFLATFGGYSPDFDYAIRGYPAVPRLGIQWQIDAHTAIKGSEYFAITPDCMMAGGSLHATWNCGIFSAWFNFDAHLFLQWRPLLYSVGFSMDLGVAFDLKVLFVHVHFSFHIGASIEIDGPPFHGKAHIDLDVISFTVEFGTAAPQPVLPWTEFRRLLPGSVKLDPKAPANATLTADALAALEDSQTASLDGNASPLLSAKVTGGLVKDLSQPKAKTHPDDPDWIINGTEFALHISSAVPIHTINGQTTFTLDNGTTYQIPQTPLGLLPMRDAAHPAANCITTSELSISITGASDSAKITLTPADSILSTALWGQQASTDAKAPRSQCTSSLHFTAAEQTPQTSLPITIAKLLSETNPTNFLSAGSRPASATPFS